MQSPLSCLRFPKKSLGLLAVAAVVAGCSSPQPSGYYDVPHDTTEADAQQKAQGRNTARAPSQLQFGFDNSQEQTATPQATEQSGTSGLPRALREAKTFLGTVPCLNAGANCPAQRITLTVAPTKEWRARTDYLDGNMVQSTLAQQGCWTIIGNAPLRLLLQTKEGATKGTFFFVNDNVLRVGSLSDVTPQLDYRLTQQADIDPINELPANTPLQCP